MHGANQMGLGPDFGNGFGGFGSPEGMAEDAVATGAMTEAEAYGSFDTPGNVDGGADQTFSYTAGVSLPKQVVEQENFTNALKAVMNAVVPGLGMMQNLGRLLGSQIGNPPNEMMTQEALNRGLLDQYSSTSLATPMGHPHMDNMMSVPMSGFGAQLGIATARDQHTGLNMGPGRPGEPGDVNRHSGIAYADPSDPYIRRRRGTEIAGMIGP